ncbi:MAG TPA: c-type cytochrome [Gemmataceae bacterium]|nr:c-type cytochrome [Gemmataceae bacterium]
MTRSHLALFLLVAAGVAALGPVDRPADAGQKKAQPKAAPGKEPPATDPLTMKVMKGFKVELLYSVPKDTQGSWVCMCHDPKGRLIVSDQYGSLYRITPPAIGGKPEETKVEQLPAIGKAQGLVWAFDALYVVVNAPNESGLYRVTDTNGDDMPDKVELLRKFDGGGGEHGPHAVMVHPDGKRLTVVCGNQTKLTQFDTTRVPTVWGEDHLLPRVPDGNGFMKGVLGPGGAIYNVTPDGKTWELFSVGFRNEYDAAYNKNGDLFTYDADMEWDFNTPWYRPTRVCLVTSGSEFGWRNGAGKYPSFYPDNLPPVLNVGPGSPTGVCFGYGAKFPQKYQDAFFMCDWSYGKLYAVHLTPSGSSYTATLEEFVTGTPLPLTDIVINPKDGAMYFTIGGRKTKSGLYRVTYTGEGVKDPPKIETKTDAGLAEQARAKRLELEKLHTKIGQPAVDAAWKELNNADRFIRFAARVAIEHQDVKLWAEKALAEKDPVTATQALLALCRVSAPDPFHRKPTDPPADPELRGKIVAALNRIDFAKLTDEQKLELIRVYHVLLNRFREPTAAERQAIIAKFDPAFPDPNRYVNGELCQMLIYLEAPSAATKTMKLLREAPTQEEQLEYVRALRVLKASWTMEQRKEYFTWFLKAANYKGGASFQGFLRLIKADAVASLTPQDLAALKPIIDANPATAKLPEEAPRPFVKAWKMDDLTPKLDEGLKGGRDFEKGRRTFAAAKCFACHRYDNEGGSYGPDLTGAVGRFSPRDLLESIIDPSKEISDQYAAVEIRTLDDRVIVGRIVNLNADNVSVNTNMLEPGSTVNVNRNNIASMKPSKVSMMPAGLLDTFKEDEILDLMAYILSRGDRTHAMFKK